MTITELAVKRGVTFVMIYLIVLGFGLFSLNRLKIDLFPKLEFPLLAIITQYTGVGPFDMETVVTRPIEEVVASVENVETISSQSSQGLSLVLLEFAWGTDMNQSEIDVRKNLEFLKGVLPADLSDPMVFTFDPSTQPILYLTVNSAIHGMAELRQIAEHNIEPRLERVKGVASSFTMGGMAREIKVLVDPARLRAHNLSIQQVMGALQMNNLQIPSGWIDNDRQEFSIQTAGEYQNLDQIAETNVATINGSVIRVKNVATVLDGFKETRQRVWANDKPALMVMLQKQSDANTVNVCRAVTSQLKNIERELPKGVQLDIFYDQSEFINRSMSNLGSTAIQAIVLTFLVLLFFLRRLRVALIVAVSIPVSMVATFAVMDQASLTLNIISMAGLALAVGMLVDNSIVVLESIFRYRESGESPSDSATKGTKEVAMAITASTLTTLAVFVPVLFVPGLAGEMFNEMVVTICFSLALSLLVALTLIPLLASRPQSMTWFIVLFVILTAILIVLTTPLIMILIMIMMVLGVSYLIRKYDQKIVDWLERLQHYYHIALTWALQRRRAVIYGALVAFLISLVAIFMRGGEFLPENDNSFIAIAVDRTPGVSMEDMEKTMHEVIRIINETVPEAEFTYCNFGQGEGVMALFSSRGSSEGDITVRLKNLTLRSRNMFEIQDELREKFKNIPDLRFSFQDRGAAVIMGTGGDIVIKIFGHDLQVAEALSEQVKTRIKNIKGIASIESSIQEARPELLVQIDRQRIADLGLSTSQVGQTISTCVLGTVATRYREGGNEYDVRVQLAKDYRGSKEDLENILIMTPIGGQLPLRSIANVEYSKAPQEITREDQSRFVNLTIDVSGRDLRSVTLDVSRALRAIPVPSDFRIEIGGTAEEQQKSFMYLALAMLVAIILTYMVMASQFESFLYPFIILITIPLSVIGVALGLIVTGTNLSVMALIGVVMLVGIVVNNGIVLVDYINQLRGRGMVLFDAIIEAGRVRLRPVLMTALTTILAMFPLALGIGESGESWAPMARSVMGGLTVATILTLVIVPVIYASTTLLGEKRRAKREARRSAKQGPRA